MDCPACRHDNIPGTDLCEHCGLDLAGLDVGKWGVDSEDPVLAREISSVKLKRALRLPGTSSVGEAIELLRDQGEGCVLVEGGQGEIVGIFTERDLVSRVLSRGRDPGRTPVAVVMTPSPVALNESDPLAWALHRMGVDGHRHIPVTAASGEIGLLSIRRVLEELAAIAD